MQSIILVLGGIFWILTYIFIISKGYKDKTYGMPLLALCANIAWEFIFSFLLPHSPPQLYINYLWFALDVVIVFQFFKYSKNEFPTLSSLTLCFVFGISVATAFIIILTGGIFLGDVDGVYAAFGQNLLMSVLFVVMFFKRGNTLRGQSIFIAIFKMLGTGLTSIHFYLFEPVSQSSFMLSFLFVSIFFFDLFYTVLIVKQYKKNNKSLFAV
ncbi:transmembrane-type terpene cyclase [Candidatus Nitrosocosmicus sp. R]